ncbi:hypothetical protein KSS87_019011 [Heliosperma pusillum]|nr:hypothetical protein KSS87_019011 [Heliosperma pusillum]
MFLISLCPRMVWMRTASCSILPKRWRGFRTCRKSLRTGKLFAIPPNPFVVILLPVCMCCHWIVGWDHHWICGRLLY